MQFKSNKSVVIRRIVFAVLVLFAASVQFAPGAIPNIGPARAMLLIPLTVSIAMNERTIPALLFGAFSGIIWDSASVNADGYFSVMLCAVGFLTAVAVTFTVQNNFRAALLIGFLATVICIVGYWLLFVLAAKADSPLSVLTGYYIPSGIYTFALTPLCYFPVKFIAEYLSKKDGKPSLKGE